MAEWPPRRQDAEVYVCPMCEGAKLVPYPTADVSAIDPNEQCDLCEGRGFVVYREKEKGASHGSS